MRKISEKIIQFLRDAWWSHQIIKRCKYLVQIVKLPSNKDPSTSSQFSVHHYIYSEGKIIRFSWKFVTKKIFPILNCTSSLSLTWFLCIYLQVLLSLCIFWKFYVLGKFWSQSGIKENWIAANFLALPDVYKENKICGNFWFFIYFSMWHFSTFPYSRFKFFKIHKEVKRKTEWRQILNLVMTNI